MKLVFDSNVLLDITQTRDPHFADSLEVVRRSMSFNGDAVVSASAVTDIYYVLRRQLASAKKAREALDRLLDLVDVCTVEALDIYTAHSAKIPDFEDAVVAAVAARIGARYIVTRNVKDFNYSLVPAITPTDVLPLLEETEAAKKFSRFIHNPAAN
jgi:predicted nucleic acid-binding protein